MFYTTEDGTLHIHQRNINGALNNIKAINNTDKPITRYFLTPATNGRNEHPILFRVGEGKNEAVIHPGLENHSHLIEVKLNPNEEREINFNIREDKPNENFYRKYPDFKIGKKKESFLKKIWRFIKNPCNYCKEKRERKKIKKIIKQKIEARNQIEQILSYYGIKIKPDELTSNDIKTDPNSHKITELVNLIQKYNNEQNLENRPKIIQDMQKKILEIAAYHNIEDKSSTSPQVSSYLPPIEVHHQPSHIDKSSTSPQVSSYLPLKKVYPPPQVILEEAITGGKKRILRR